MRIPLALVLLFPVCSSCSTETSQASSTEPSVFELSKVTGVITDKALEEASGLAASVKNPGYLWTHNDSGDEARIFLIDTTGARKATVLLANATNRDWEDIAIGPGPEGKTYLYIGDIGDNEAKHQYKYIYRVEEPWLDLTRQRDTTLYHGEQIIFEYPDGLRDAEALMVDPVTNDLFVISKRELKCNVYRLPYPQITAQPRVAERVLERVQFNKPNKGDTLKKGDEVLIKGYHSKYYYQIVSADISAAGDEVVVKSYSSVYYWKRQPGEAIVSLLQREPVVLPYMPEIQGEAIAFEATGAGYYTLNERMRGNKQQLIYYKRVDDSTTVTSK